MGWGRAWGASGDVRWSHHAPFVCVTQTGAGAVPGSRCCRQRTGQCPGTAPGTGLAERGVNAPLPGASLPLGGGAQSSAHRSKPLPGPGCCTVQSPLTNQCPKEQCGLHLPRGGGSQGQWLHSSLALLQPAPVPHDRQGVFPATPCPQNSSTGL